MRRALVLAAVLLGAGTLLIAGNEAYGAWRLWRRSRRLEQPATCEAGVSHLRRERAA